MKALVTGASGFIGSTLVGELNTLGFEVRALLRSSSNPSNLEGLQYQLAEGDLNDYESLKRAVSGVDYIFHLAGVTAAPNRSAYIEFNSLGTERLARATSEVNPGVSRFVYVSSLAAGGPSPGLNPKTEKEADSPVSAYGDSKLDAEKRLSPFQNSFPISIVRPPIVYGPKDKGMYVLVRIVSRNIMPLFQGEAEGGKKYYSAIHVRDLCRGIIQSGLTPKEKVPSGEVFYLAGDGMFSQEELLSSMSDAIGNDPIRLKVPQFLLKGAAWSLTKLGALINRDFPLNQDKLNEILPDYWICSNEKAKELLGFSPEYSLTKGMENTVQWYRKNKWI